MDRPSRKDTVLPVSNLTLFYALFAAQWVVLLFVGVLVLGAFHQIGGLQQRLEPMSPTPSRLHKGERLPANLGDALPPRALVAFLLSRGCSGCEDFCRTIRDMDLGDWTLVTVLGGAGDADETTLPLPACAQAVYDKGGRWSRELSVKAMPTVLAVVGDRLFDQKVAPNVAWISQVVQQPVSAGEEVVREKA